MDGPILSCHRTPFDFIHLVMSQTMWPLVSTPDTHFVVATLANKGPSDTDTDSDKLQRVWISPPTRPAPTVSEAPVPSEKRDKNKIQQWLKDHLVSPRSKRGKLEFQRKKVSHSKTSTWAQPTGQVFGTTGLTLLRLLRLEPQLTEGVAENAIDLYRLHVNSMKPDYTIHRLQHTFISSGTKALRPTQVLYDDTLGMVVLLKSDHIDYVVYS